MRYRLTVPVDGALFLRRGEPHASGHRDGFDFTFVTDARGQVTHVSVEASVPTSRLERFASSLEPGVGEAATSIQLNGDPEVVHTLVAALQQLESHLAFEALGAVRRINYREATHAYVPETEAERERVPVFEFSISTAYQQPAHAVSSEWFRRLVDGGREFDELVPLKAFWNEGRNLFDQMRYVQASHQFYFVIEGLFAEGKTGEHEVLKAFRRSATLTATLEWNYSHLFAGTDRHSDRLRELMTLEKCDASVDGLRRFLIRIRGRLHHYSAQSTTVSIHPHAEHQFETAAYLLLLVSRQAIDRQVVAIHRRNAAPSV